MTAVDVVGNNLANLNTPGYKASSVSFRDLVTESIGAGLGETQVGFGTGQPFTTREFNQGAVQSSTGLLDGAIEGDGFFVLSGSQGQMLYTRAGNFQVDSSGNLTTMTGEDVQGWMEGADGTVNSAGPIGNIVVPVGTVKPPIASQNFSMSLNLDSNGVNGQDSGTFSTPMQVYDSLGDSHVLTVTFTVSTTPNQWTYAVTIPAADMKTAPTVPLATGTIAFNASGTLITPPSTTPTVAVPIVGLADGAKDMNLNWSLYDSTGAPTLTQFAQTSAVSANAQDGSAAASLTSIGLADGGSILAQYSNGQQLVVAQLALANVRNSSSLIAVGNNNFQGTAVTALPAIGVPGTGGRGTVEGGAIESSTVDIATEFTNLIIYQRAYEANARVVTAVDELSQDTINLKR
jgi:flagellar hook protein FlgE